MSFPLSLALNKNALDECDKVLINFYVISVAFFTQCVNYVNGHLWPFGEDAL